jgi:hypothetical protein
MFAGKYCLPAGNVSCFLYEKIPLGGDSDNVWVYQLKNIFYICGVQFQSFFVSGTYTVTDTKEIVQRYVPVSTEAVGKMTKRVGI